MPPSDMLLQIVVGLREIPSPPESFVWSAVPDSPEARLWAVLTAEPARLASVAAFLREIPGVRKVLFHDHAKGPELRDSSGATMPPPFTD